MLKVNDKNSRIRIQDPDPDPNPDPLVRSMYPRIRIRIRIHPKMSWIRNTDFYVVFLNSMILQLPRFWLFRLEKDLFRKQDGGLIQDKRRPSAETLKHFPQGEISLAPAPF